MGGRADNLVAECKRQEESCLYTSTTLFEWLKCMRVVKVIFVVAPIILGGVAAWPLLSNQNAYKWVTGVCALLAGFAPAIYKALDLDVNLNLIAKQANVFKTLQDRFRQARTVTALGAFEEFEEEFDRLMARMDDARASSLTAPERFFRKAQAKIDAGHYDFAVDAKTGQTEIQTGMAERPAN